MNMNTKSSSSSIFSLDSLEASFLKKGTNQEIKPKESTDTILVPFYEKDVLMKIPKCPIKKLINKRQKSSKNNDKNDNDIETEATRSYLVNKNPQKSRRTSYLETFRKQFVTAERPPRNNNEDEIRSLSPEVGDTERESISDNDQSPNNDFYNTEAYNDIYYEKIMNQEIEHILQKNFDQALQFDGDIKSNSNDENIANNLKSVSEISQIHRRTRRATIEPMQNIHLGGLGPDMENIKPRLERARSLQRYSEKVRMENRLKIYKQSIIDDNKQNQKKSSVNQQNTEKTNKIMQKENESSYLVNKLPVQNKIKKKSKSANDQYENRHNKDKKNLRNESTTLRRFNRETKLSHKQDCDVQENTVSKNIGKLRVNSSRSRDTKSETTKNNEAPISTTYMANLDALRSLEEKHRMYQERVKQLGMIE